MLEKCATFVKVIFLMQDNVVVACNVYLSVYLLRTNEPLELDISYTIINMYMHYIETLLTTSNLVTANF
jgi:hypothetical protein